MYALVDKVITKVAKFIDAFALEESKGSFGGNKFLIDQESSVV